MLRQIGTEFSRRDFLKRAGGAGLALTGVGSVPRAALASSGLTVMDWTGYEIPELHKSYIEKYGASPDITVFADMEEAWQKLSGGVKPDLVHSDHWQIPARREAGLFDVWDVSRLRNYPDLLTSLVELPTLQHEGKQIGVPIDWGINSICYRTDLINIEEDSWTALWDKKYAGKLAVSTQMDSLVQPAALVLGISNPWVNDPEIIKAIEAKLVEQRALSRFYWSDPTQLAQAMASGEVAIAFAWPAVFTDLQKQGVPVRYMRPKEGVLGWALGMLLMNDRQGDEQKAYDFVDAWTNPSTGRWLIENYGYGHSNRKSTEGVDPAILANLMLEDPTKTLKDSYFMPPVSIEVQSAYVAMVERVKAGG